MKIDYRKTLIREQNPPTDPARLGDSCFETSSYLNGRFLLGDYDFVVDLTQFVTPIGTIRHPDAPFADDKGESWREDDMTTDNELPLYMASKKAGMSQTSFIKNKAVSRGYRTGNGNLVSPGYFAELMDWQWLRVICLVVQLLIFKFPIRWGDSSEEPWYKLWKHIELNKSSCDGYVQWMQIATQAPRWVRLLISKETLKLKIRMYYAKEPNSQWIIDVLDQVIDRYWV